MLARRCYASIKYKGTDITEALDGDVLGFSFKDNMDKADGIELSLADPTGKWMKEWFPEEGDFIEAEIHTVNWRKDGETERLMCGRFILDTPSYSGFPNQMSLNGTSVPKDTGITDPQNRTFEKIAFSALALQISTWYSCELMYLVNEDPIVSYLKQENESDISLLSNLCREKGYFLKISENRIVIAEDKNLQGNPVMEIGQDTNGLKGFSFSFSLVSKYKECSISYFDVRSGKLLKYVHPIDQDGEKVYHLDQRANSYEEAVGICKSLVREISKGKFMCQLDLVGNVNVVAGATVKLKDFGRFDGEYLITEADHQIDGTYTVSASGYRLEVSDG